MKIKLLFLSIFCSFCFALAFTQGAHASEEALLDFLLDESTVLQEVSYFDTEMHSDFALGLTALYGSEINCAVLYLDSTYYTGGTCDSGQIDFLSQLIVYGYSPTSPLVRYSGYTVSRVQSSTLQGFTLDCFGRLLSVEAYRGCEPSWWSGDDSDIITPKESESSGPTIYSEWRWYLEFDSE
jgi:hypothetical protein